MEEKRITMVRGDTLSFTATLEDLEDTVDGVYFTCRTDWDGSIVFQKSLSDGIDDIGDSSYSVRVAPEDTETVEPGKYVYDLELDIGDDVYTPLRGVLVIAPDATY